MSNTASMPPDPEAFTTASESTVSEVSELVNQALTKQVNYEETNTEISPSLVMVSTHTAATTDGKPNGAAQLSSVTTLIATEREDLIAALKLIAESIAQQRQVAARSIIHHWFIWISMGTIFAAITFLMYNDPSDCGRIILTCTGALMVALLLTRNSVAGYLDLAENTGTWKWLYGPDESANIRRAEKWRNYVLLKKHQVEFERAYDIVVAVQYQDAIIATLVMRILCCNQPDSASDMKSKAAERRPMGQNHAAFIRALTVAYRYRYLGLGGALLRLAVMMREENDWKSIEFADRHAMSPQVLPRHFNFSSGGLAQAWIDRLRNMVSEQQKGSGGFPWILDEDHTTCDGKLPKRLQLDAQFERLRITQIAGEMLSSETKYPSEH
ncbi:hypothetical protein PENANT_c002G06943 [Penicillium antarcticum]|uniref:Uncharacterized protein n=1 Tax=Penicillium antarcticum TaxID=416450 RepID=A0A1V6QLU8_9EURO|nr:hypothetical protein PENANT_c002G06943 [Penicillium antarcticum]